MSDSTNGGDRTGGNVSLPMIQLTGHWMSVFEGGARDTLETSVLPLFLQRQRWFGGKSRTIESACFADRGPITDGPHPAGLALLEVRYANHPSDLYFVPMAIAVGDEADRFDGEMRNWAIARLESPNGHAILYDAVADDSFCLALIEAVERDRQLPTERGVFRTSSTTAFQELRGEEDRLVVIRGPASSSNTLMFFGDRLLMKAFRRPEFGLNPDLEIGRFLTEETDFNHLPRVAGSLEYESSRGLMTVGILQERISNESDGWEHALSQLKLYYPRVAERSDVPDVPTESLVDLAQAKTPAIALEVIGTSLEAAGMLGRRTAEMHLALASRDDVPAFQPEAISAEDMSAIQAEIRSQAEHVFAALKGNLERLPASVAVGARTLLAAERATLERILGDADAHAPNVTKTRIHGDYHLGQVLRVEDDFVILDFEGEPTRSIESRRGKYSPIRDVAGMVRSYHYAAYAALFAFTERSPEEFARLVPWAELWQRWVSAAFLREYLATASGASFLPREEETLSTLLERFTLGKALYELVYELNNRPDWVRIPLGGVLSLLGLESTRSER